MAGLPGRLLVSASLVQSYQDRRGCRRHLARDAVPAAVLAGLAAAVREVYMHHARVQTVDMRYSLSSSWVQNGFSAGNGATF